MGEQPGTAHGFWLFFAVDRGNEWKSWFVPNGTKLRLSSMPSASIVAAKMDAIRP